MFLFHTPVRFNDVHLPAHRWINESVLHKLLHDGTIIEFMYSCELIRFEYYVNSRRRYYKTTIWSWFQIYDYDCYIRDIPDWRNTMAAFPIATEMVIWLGEAIRRDGDRAICARVLRFLLDTA